MVALFRLLESSKQVGRYHAFLGYLPDEDEAPRPASPPARESRIGWVYDPDTGQLHPPGTSIARRAIPPQRAPSLLRTARLLVGAARALLRGETRHDTTQRAHQERRSDPDDDPED